MKNKKIILLLLLLLIFPLNIKSESKKAVKGDLRCPPKYLNKGCVESEDGNKVTVTAERDGITVIKSVKKTDVLGSYDVSFSVKGELNTEVKPNAYVVLLMDTSGSVETYFNQAVEAVKSFAKELHEKNPNVEIALVQFAGSKNVNNKATRAVTMRDFKKEDFENTTICRKTAKATGYCKKQNIGDWSQIQTGFAAAEHLFDSKDLKDDDLKYIVIFGDGEYQGKASSRIDYLKEIKNRFVTKYKNLYYYGLRFVSNFCEKGQQWTWLGDTNELMKDARTICGGNQILCGQNKCKKNKDNTVKYYTNCNRQVMNYIVSNLTFDEFANNITDDNKRNVSLSENVLEASSENDWSSKFEEIAKTIAENIKNKFAPYYGEIKDNIGDSFETDDMRNVATLKVNQTPLSETKIVEIHIKPDSSEGWHPTNDGFSFNYEATGDISDNIISNINPEVYWEPVPFELEACSSKVDIVGNNQKYSGKYYIEECQQGNQSNNTNGFIANLIINNLEDKTHKFYLKKGLGFSINLSLSNNVSCKYELIKNEDGNYRILDEYETVSKLFENVDKKFDSVRSKINDIDILNNEIETLRLEIEDMANEIVGKEDKNSEIVNIINEKVNTIEAKETLITKLENAIQTELGIDENDLDELIRDRNYYKSQLDDLIEVVNNITEDTDGFSENNLTRYRTKFIELKPTVTIKYKDPKKDSATFELVNSDDELADKLPNVDCSDIKTTELNIQNGKTIKLIESKTCNLSVSKNMNVKQTYIDMTTAEQTDLKDDRLTLFGGNNYYINFDSIGGYISINMIDADYIGNTIKLDGTKTVNGNENLFQCEFETYEENKIFRQIDVSDPFVQKTNNIKKREIGKNWSNANGKYNFINIIDKEIWNPTKYDTIYQISKENIENIKKNSTSESYLGTNCYINNDNIYTCPFTRNQYDVDGNNTNYFSNIKLNENKS